MSQKIPLLKDEERWNHLRRYFRGDYSSKGQLKPPYVYYFRDYIRLVLNRTPIMVTETEEEHFQTYRRIFLDIALQQDFYKQRGWINYHPLPTIPVGDLSQIDRYWWKPRKRRKVLAELVATLPSDKTLHHVFKKAEESALKNWLKQVNAKPKPYTISFGYSLLLEAQSLGHLEHLIRVHNLYPARTTISSR